MVSKKVILSIVGFVVVLFLISAIIIGSNNGSNSANSATNNPITVTNITVAPDSYGTGMWYVNATITPNQNINYLTIKEKIFETKI